MKSLIRNATAADTATILRLIRALAEYEKLSDDVVADEAGLRESLFGPKAKAFALIAELGGKPIGFAVCFYNFSTFLGRPGIYVEDVFVEPDARGHGIGMAFFRHLAARVKKENCGRLEWAVLDWNQPAIDFYKNMGAEAMEEWTVWRLKGDALAALAKVEAV